jgi:hypothetical protein
MKLLILKRWHEWFACVWIAWAKWDSTATQREAHRLKSWQRREAATVTIMLSFGAMPGAFCFFLFCLSSPCPSQRLGGNYSGRVKSINSLLSILFSTRNTCPFNAENNSFYWPLKHLWRNGQSIESTTSKIDDRFMLQTNRRHSAKLIGILFVSLV